VHRDGSEAVVGVRNGSGAGNNSATDSGGRAERSPEETLEGRHVGE
jgi:hypothetical protein